jgi:acyl-CoA reductase-like NAD-dependent aldehyde dehydrogenase
MEWVTLVDRSHLVAALETGDRFPLAASIEDIFNFLQRLAEQLRLRGAEFYEKTYLETGFIASDSAEIVDGAREFLEDFEIYARATPLPEQTIRHSYSGLSKRGMRLMDRPLRCVAIIVPQNASLTLSIISIASALYAGARVVLRPSLQSGSTGNLLAQAVFASHPPPQSVSIVNCYASDFLDACYASPSVDLIHYIGSNQYALSVLVESFKAGKMCVLDGQGNGWLLLDETFDLEAAVPIITAGATRFNGEICTSVNGVLATPAVYPRLRERMVEVFHKLQVGHPLREGVQVGPLFSEKQALELGRTVAQAEILCGGEVDGAYFRPAVIAGVGPEDSLVRDGFFGPAVWIAEVPEQDFTAWLHQNRYPLSDTILSRNQDLIQQVARSSRAARICVNEDPSIESMFEPWGGYPPAGINPVSLWINKYRRSFQMDGQLREISRIPRDLRAWNC